MKQNNNVRMKPYYIVLTEFIIFVAFLLINIMSTIVLCWSLMDILLCSQNHTGNKYADNNTMIIMMCIMLISSLYLKLVS